MKKQIKRRIRAGFTALLTAILVCSGFAGNPQSAQAAAASTDTSGSVTVKYPIADVEFSLYNVGTVDADGKYVLNETYSKYGVNINDSGAAEILADYVTRDESSDDAISPVSTVVTENTGGQAEDGSDACSAVFTGLSQNLYLLIGQAASDGSDFYIPQNVFLSIPTTMDGEAHWNISVENKYTKIPIEGPGYDRSKLTVMKTWKNDDENSRPTSVTVQLLLNGKTPEDAIASARSETEQAQIQRALKSIKGEDGSAVTEVVLNADNNWTYNWENLSVKYDWSVVEKSVPDGYTVMRTTEKTTIMLTNMAGTPESPDEPDEPDQPDNPENPTKPSGDNPSNPTKPSSDTPSGGSKTQNLPYTGQLWWPIPMMVAGGLFLILIGLLVLRKHKS